MTNIPSSLQGVLWSKNISNLDLRRDKSYVIHQILAYGTWEHLNWLFKTYKKSEIKKVFIEYPAKDYTEQAFNFAKNIILELPQKKIDKRYYVKTFPRVIR